MARIVAGQTAATTRFNGADRRAEQGDACVLVTLPLLTT